MLLSASAAVESIAVNLDLENIIEKLKKTHVFHRVPLYELYIVLSIFINF